MDSTNSGKPMFPATEWTKLEDLAGCPTEQQQHVIATLMERYWKPVYVWLRRQGYKADKAEDYTQGFFCDIVLERDLFKRADRARGRFRTFLLSALKSFMSDAYRKDHALKRNPTKGLISLESVEVLPENLYFTSPDEMFTYIWASNVLDRVIEQLKEEYLTKGLEKHWKVFSEKVLRPIQDGTPEPLYESICQDLNVQDEYKASNMTNAVKRRFRTLLKQVVLAHVGSDQDVDEEIAELFSIFSQREA